ncbi:Synaptic vesicle membrane protein VAT-1 -like [Araneus ventricosus]|uniref:Synaptic vesicle membrane protein VAT-1-like n=1 Tax=Araneus ventricosus TaxID=182803 RepID=A0A4Y2DG42_ARAVE|nr:Synaptic vesicle membrane protein VAT-1 -like [Araneus ventricosus]
MLLDVKRAAGLAVASLCKTLPDVTLIGTASKHKHETIAEYFTHLFDHSQDYVQETKKLLPEGVDLVLDCVCGEDVNKGYSLLKPLGRYVLYGTSSIVSGETKSFFSFAKSWWQVDKVSPIKLFDENKILAGFHLRHLLYQQGCHEYVRGVVSKVFKLWEDKKIKVTTDSEWAFEDVAEAMQKMHDRKNIGKITLLSDKAPKPQQKAPKEKEKSITSGESTDTDPKDEQTPPPYHFNDYLEEDSPINERRTRLFNSSEVAID